MNLKSRTAIAAAAAAALCTSVQATPRAAEASGADFLVSAENLEGLHVGGYYRYTSREVNDYYDLTQDNIAFMVGYDLLDWFSIYGVVGTGDAELDNYSTDRDYSVIYGVGGWLNILDHDLMSNLSCETKFRVSASAQIVFGKPDLCGEEFKYNEFYGALTFSVVNELIGNKNIFPDAIGIFAGPVWDVLDCDDDSYETTGNDAGFAVGLDVYVTRRVGLSASYETYGSGNNAINFSLDCRF